MAKCSVRIMYVNPQLGYNPALNRNRVIFEQYPEDATQPQLRCRDPHERAT